MGTSSGALLQSFPQNREIPWSSLVFITQKTMPEWRPPAFMGLIPLVSPLQSSPVSEPSPTLHVHAPDHTHPACSAEGSCLPAQQLQTSYGLGDQPYSLLCSGLNYAFPNKVWTPAWGGPLPSYSFLGYFPSTLRVLYSFLISYSHLFISLIILYIVLCQFSPLCGF